MQRRFFLTLALAAGLLLGNSSRTFAMPAEAVAPINDRAYGTTVRELIKKSKSRLWIMLYQTRYYEEYPDTLTNRFLEDLIAAKQRGVDVRLLVDTGDWNPSEKNENNTDFMDRLTTSGIMMWEDATDEVSHQKVMLVDENITVVSSNNWTFYSIASNNEVAVTVFSKPLNDWFTHYFEERLQKARPRANVSGNETSSASFTSGSVTASELPDLQKLQVADVQPVANRDFYPAVHDLLVSATKSIDVVQRSLNIYSSRPTRSQAAALPGEPPSETNVLAQDLIAAAKRGVKVRVVLDYSDNFDNSSNAETAAMLRSNGVEVFADAPTTQTHAKLVVVDDDRVVVGSTNWTYDAIEQGNEASVVLTSPAINREYKAYVDNLLQSGRPFLHQPPSIWDSATTGTRNN